MGGGGGEVVGGAVARGVGLAAEEGSGGELDVLQLVVWRLGGGVLVHGLVLEGREPASPLKCRCWY